MNSETSLTREAEVLLFAIGSLRELRTIGAIEGVPYAMTITGMLEYERILAHAKAPTAAEWHQAMNSLKITDLRHQAKLRKSASWIASGEIGRLKIKDQEE